MHTSSRVEPNLPRLDSFRMAIPVICYSFYPPRSDALFSNYFGEDLLLLRIFPDGRVVVEWTIAAELRSRDVAGERSGAWPGGGRSSAVGLVGLRG